MPRQIVIYHQPGCPACEQAMTYLTRRGVTFQARNIREDPAALRELIQMRLMTTPVITIDGAPVEGFDPARLDALLGEESGQKAEGSRQ